MLTGAQELTRNWPRWQELDALDEPGSPAGSGSTGDDRGKSKEELVQESHL
jgi:hypothetical protein